MSDISRHLRMVRSQMRRNFFRSILGWWHWHVVTRTKGFLPQTAVVLIPGTDKETNLLALLYLDQLLDSRRWKNAVVLSHDPAAIKSAHLFSQRILAVKKFSRKKAERLMQYYCLCEFDKRFVIASAIEPYGRNGDRLVGKRGTTLEDVFVIGVYRIWPFVRPELPVYDGDDADVRMLLEAKI